MMCRFEEAYYEFIEKNIDGKQAMFEAGYNRRGDVMDVKEAKKKWKAFERETDKRIHELEEETGLTCFGFTYQYTRREGQEGFKQLYTKVGI